MAKEQDISTLGVRAGTARSQFNEHSEALFLTSSFVFANAAQAAARFTGGAAEAKNTLRAPDSRAICTISRLVFPRTIESSTSSAFLPLNSIAIAFSFCRTDL